MSGTEKIAMNQCICGAIADGRAFTIVCAIASTMPESLMTPMKIPTANRVTVITIAFEPYSLIFLLCSLTLRKFTISATEYATIKMEYNGTGRSMKRRTSIAIVRIMLNQ